MEVIEAPKNEPREKFGQYSGWAYTVGNVGMIFKGPLDQLVTGNNVKFQDIYADPYSFGIGVAFMACSVTMSKWGNKNLGMATANGFGCAGSLVMTEHLMQQGNLSGALGFLIYTLATGYGTYRGIKDELNARNSEKNKNNEQKSESNFKKNFKNITEKYPYSPLGVTEIASNSFILQGALATRDPVLLGIASAWAVGSAFLGLAKPKSGTTKKSDQTLTT